MVDEDLSGEDVHEEKIVEGEIVESKKSASSDSDQATILLSLESLIKSHIASIDRNKIELKKQKEMLEDSYNNDPVYQEHAKAAKEAAKVKSQTRLQITKQSANVQLNNKIRSLSSEVKEKQSALSDYLLEYQRMTGVNEIEGEDGEVREIVNVAKLIKKHKS